LTGAWLVEMPGIGAVGNLLQSSAGTILGGLYTVMAANTECPNFPKATRFLFVNVPVPLSENGAGFYGTTDINTLGSSVDFNTSYYTVGQPLTSTPITFQADAACATTMFGSVISYPVNASNALGAFGGGDSVIAKSQFLDGAIPAPSSNNEVQEQNVVGLAMPSSAVSTTTLAGKHFIGLLYTPATSSSSYDSVVLPEEFGDEAGSSSACTSFQAGITASLTKKTLSQAPSAQAIYGGDFPNGVPGATGTETCDVAIDLGAQDATNNGLFPGAQLYAGTSTAVTSTSAAAVVSQIDGRSVILLRSYYSGSGQRLSKLLVLFEALQ
jgi:hypothetical protein